MKKRLRIALCIVLIVLLAAILFIENNSNRMLRAVDLTDLGLRRVDYTYFNDFLQYVDGYEIAAYTINGTQWQSPEGWIMLDSAQSVDDLTSELGIAINMDALLNLSLGGTDCSSYCFVDNRTATTFDEQDYYFAFCDDTYPNNPVIFIYRGHHLHGI